MVLNLNIGISCGNQVMVAWQQCKKNIFLSSKALFNESHSNDSCLYKLYE